MRIDDLIQQLRAIKKRHGNLRVGLYSENDETVNGLDVYAQKTDRYMIVPSEIAASGCQVVRTSKTGTVETIAIIEDLGENSQIWCN